MTDVQSSDVLDKAIELLETWGWCQYKLLREDGCMCVLGALRAASGVDKHKWSDRFGWRIVSTHFNSRAMQLSDRAESCLRLAIETQNYPIAASTTYWNDERGRTAEQVIAMLTEARDLALAALQ